MTDTLQIGPFAVPLIVPIVLAAASLGSAAENLAFAQREDAAKHLFMPALLAGAVAARLAFLWTYRSAYLAYPLSALNLGDGGWDMPFGIAVAWIYGLGKAQSAKLPRKPISMALATASVVWLLGLSIPLFFSTSASELPKSTFVTLEGGSISLGDTKGQPTAINLWATWCPSCQSEMPVLQQAQAQYPNVNFVFVDEGERADRVRNFLAKQHLSLRNVLLDESGQLARQFDEQALPTTLFFDSEGHLASVRIGGLTSAILKQRLESIDDRMHSKRSHSQVPEDAGRNH